MVRSLFPFVMMFLLLDNGAVAGELHAAAMNGDLAAIQALQDAGADLDHRDDFEMTALHFVAYHGHQDVVHFLLASGANINAQNTNGYSALMLAIGQDHFTIIDTLLEHHANINLVANVLDEHLDRKGRTIGCLERETALSISLVAGNCELVNRLVLAGAEVNVVLNPVRGGTRCRGSGYALFHKVVEKGDYDIIELFLQHGVDPSVKFAAFDPFSGRSSLVGPIDLAKGNPEITSLIRSYMPDREGSGDEYFWE